jgi:D-alanyl-D-alanine carboxypeptidase (penicillin-binding protein 5/6)
MKLRRRIVILAAALLAGLAPACAPRSGVARVDAVAASSAPPPVDARHAIVVELDSGAVVFAKDAERATAVASLQKLVAALVAVEAGDPGREVVVQSSDQRTQPVVVPLRAGDRYRRRDLLRLMLVGSANDASLALARDIAGNATAFSHRMNATAARLGMKDSRFLNPHGLTVKGQHSTARDIAIAARAAYADPFLRECGALRSFRARPRDAVVTSGNPLLGRLPGCDGMKSGYTRAAGRCLVATARTDGRALLVVLLGGREHSWANDAEALFRWAAVCPSR